jgi:hypothetical protein
MPESMGLFFRRVKFTMASVPFMITDSTVLNLKTTSKTTGGGLWCNITKTLLVLIRQFLCTQPSGRLQGTWTLLTIL